MSVNSIGEMSGVYQAYGNYSSAPVKEAATQKEVNEGVVYESSNISKMSKSERSALVEQLKADQANRQAQFTNLVKDMISKQGGTFALTDDIWKFLASGNYEVDAETKAAAEEAVSEDGYWGVKQTSQRIFDFAMALSGGDEDKMKEMQEAFEKGFSEATKSWGKELPGISSDTYDAVTKKFEDFYNGENTDTEEV